MNQAGLPGGVQGVGQVRDDPFGVGRRELALALQPLAEALARDVVHHVVEQPGRLSRRMDRDDVGVPELGDHAGLGEEPLGDRGVHGELGMHDLDRHRAVEGGIAREEDDSHPAGPSSRSSRYWLPSAACRRPESSGSVTGGS